MDLQLNGKVAIVTGASRGIGCSIAQVLAAEGVRLVLVARTKHQLEEVAESCLVDTLVQVADLRNPEVPAAIRTGSAEFTIGGSVNAALLNLTKSLADRGIRDGIRVNAINPGAILTERLRTRVESYAAEHGIEEAEAPVRMAQALGVERFGKPEEIARLVAFLASPLAGYCQGSIIDADGGQTRTL